MKLTETIGTLSPRMRRALVIAAVAIVVLAAVLVWTQRRGQDHSLLRLYGNVDIREVQLGFRQSGRIAQMTFEEGDAVANGAVMATLDAQPFREALAAAEANVQGAQADLAKLRQVRPQAVAQTREALNQARAVATDAARNYDRQRGLLATGSSSQRIVDAARAAHDQAAAGVKAAQAALTQITEGSSEDIAAGEARLAAAQAARGQAATALADTVLRAPSAGTVTSRVREPGSMVTSQSTVYTVSLDTPVYVRAYVDEPELGSIAPGMRVRVHTDSSGKVYHGQIGFISPRAEFTPKTVETTSLRTELVYRLRIVVEYADAALRQGMPVTVEADARPAVATRTDGA